MRIFRWRKERGSRARTIARGTAMFGALLVISMLAITPAQAAPERPTEELTARDVQAWLDGAVPALLEREGIPGAAVSVVHGGEILTTRGYGVAEVGSADTAPVPIDPDQTLLRVGSLSKVPLAIAVMQQVERGDVDIHEPHTAD